MEREKLPGGEEGEASRITGRGWPSSFSYRALRSAVSSLTHIDDFHCEKIDSGFFSDVLKVQHLQSGKIMVLKLNKVESNRGNVLREVQILNHLCHPNILRFMGVCVHRGQLHALTEYINGGNLEQLLDSSVPLPWSLRVKLALNIAYGLHYLHSKDILHRDLTSKNCLVRRENNDYTAIVGDFGLAEKISLSRKEQLPVVGSPYWMAPEVLRAEFYNETADVFSYGIILCEIIARIPADPDYMPRTKDYGLNVATFRSMVEVSCPKAFPEIAFNCCNMEPTLRPSFLDVTRCLEDVLQQQRCTEGAKTMPSDAGESSVTPGTIATLSGVARTVSDRTKHSLLHELGMQHQQPDQSLCHSQSKCYVPPSPILPEPCSEARTKEAIPRVKPFSHHEDLKRGKMKLFTQSESLSSLVCNQPSPVTLQLSSFITSTPAINKQCADTLKCHSLPTPLKLPHDEHPAVDTLSTYLTDDSQSPACSSSAASGEESNSPSMEEWPECSFDHHKLPQSSTPHPDSIVPCTPLSDSHHTVNISVYSTPLESLSKLRSLRTATLEQTEPEFVPSESPSSVLDQHEVLPRSCCHGPAPRPSSNQDLIYEVETFLSPTTSESPGPVRAEPKPKLPERKS